MSVKPIIPTIPEIRERMDADTAHYLPGSSNRPYKSLLSVLNTVFAGAIWSMYGFASWILQQIDPLTADESWLTIWGDKLGIPRKDGVRAQGSVTFSGELNTPIPYGTLMQTSDNRRFYTGNDCVLGESVIIFAESVGYAHNSLDNQKLTLVNPISGVSLTIVGEISGGADQESLAAWAGRINNKLDQLQDIGDADDYARWVKATHPAIEDAWAYGNTPRLGDVTIYCLIHPNASTADTLSIATKSMQSSKNVGANIVLSVPLSLPVTIRIAYDGQSLIAEDLQLKINADIDALFLKKRHQNASLYPSEIDRVIQANFPYRYTLLSPVAKVIPESNQIMIVNGQISYE